ncbi:MAG: N-acetyltransferase family protein [Nocardioidaceae bacterium]
MQAETGFAVRPAEPGDWAAVAAVMDTPGDPRRCWCQYFLLRGQAWSGAARADLRAALQEQVSAGDRPGLVAYDAATPVGWVQVGPKPSYPRLASSGISREPADAADPDGLWALTCFVVPRPHRGRGVAHALLRAAVAHAAGQGAALLEAYPVDTEAGPASVAELYHGSLAMFRAAGFTEVRRPTPRRAVVRLTLAGAAGA